jgi:hypothetical protein
MTDSSVTEALSGIRTGRPRERRASLAKLRPQTFECIRLIGRVRGAHSALREAVDRACVEVDFEDHGIVDSSAGEGTLP